MHPTDALSPKWRIEQGTINVLYTHPSTDWSVATMTYDGQPGCVGIRWNGDINDPTSLGYPSARGNGAWFILPEGPAQMMLAMVDLANATGMLPGEPITA
jgi:hypothetical protein